MSVATTPKRAKRGTGAVTDWAEELAIAGQPFGIFQTAIDRGYQGRVIGVNQDFLAMQLVSTAAVGLFWRGHDPRQDANYTALTAFAVSILAHATPADVPSDPAGAVRWLTERTDAEPSPLVIGESH